MGTVEYSGKIGAVTVNSTHDPQYRPKKFFPIPCDLEPDSPFACIKLSSVIK